MKSMQQPLADRMRPSTLDDFFGHHDLVGEGTFLRQVIAQDAIPSLLLWGPSGSGKTTLASIIAKETQSNFVTLPAVGSGVKDLRKVIDAAILHKQEFQKTIVFIDEIHRWNKSQQDALLPHVESGLITLIGATTENPSFEINGALLSRIKVVVMNALSEGDILSILRRALKKQARETESVLQCDDAALEMIARFSSGDGRVALNVLDACLQYSPQITITSVKQVLQKPHLIYDKDGEQHYNMISALHKSMRGGDADASLYWLVRMLEAGEDPLYIARRLVRFASEDIGLANSFALPQAIAAYQACHMIGMPECGVNLAQAAVYLAKSKKSNALYVAYNQVRQDVLSYPNEPVPLHLRNASTKLMKDIGYGKGYKYTPNYKDAKESQQEYLPDKLRGKKYIQFE